MSDNAQFPAGYSETGRSALLNRRLLHLDDVSALSGVQFIDALEHVSGKSKHRAGVLGLFSLKHHRMPAVAALANLRIEFYAAEERQAKLLSGPLSAALGENVDLLMAVRALEVAHVFDHADDVDFHGVEHLDCLARVL